MRKARIWLVKKRVAIVIIYRFLLIMRKKKAKNQKQPRFRRGPALMQMEISPSWSDRLRVCFMKLSKLKAQI